MCGIAGIFSSNTSEPIDPRRLQRMTDAIAHRGPDGGDVFISDGIGLGHRRLSIIDLATGAQPMVDPVTGNVIVYNGEVYNYLELRAELETHGHQFRTDSDTEVLLKAFSQWGEDCLSRLNGMWAFAIWNPTKQSLFLARDRVGVKPLHYKIDEHAFIFASEIKSIFAAGASRELDYEQLDLYLTFGYVPGANTFFRGISRLPAGHFMVVSRSGISIRKYWDLPDIDEQSMLRDKKAIYERFEFLLTDAVRIRMRSDVPFGAFLSGGLDSASVVALMRDASPIPPETFTIGFDDPEFDERKLAAEVAEQFSTRHHEHIVTPDNFHDALELVNHHYDEPFGDASAIATGHVSDVASRHVKMVLTGDGGDEVLSGYPAYQVERSLDLWRSIPPPIRSAGRKLISLASTKTTGAYRYRLNRYERLLDTSEMPFEDRILAKQARLQQSLREQLLLGRAYTASADFMNEFMKSCSYRHPFYRLMHFNIKLTLPDSMLTKVDRMTMAFSLEARSPFLDYRLIEFMVNVDKKIKLPGVTRKQILRQTIGKRLPKSLLSASKRGFVVPLREWFKDDSIAELFDVTVLRNLDLDRDILRRIFSENKLGLKDYGNTIWQLFLLERSTRPSTPYRSKSEKLESNDA